MKKILLKLAHYIYKKYNKTIEIEFGDIIKFKDNCYSIKGFQLTQEIGYITTLKMELQDISMFLDSHKI